MFESLLIPSSLLNFDIYITNTNSKVGNVYVKYSDEEDAETAVQALNGRFYAGRTLKVEYSPVTDFREARCRQYDEGTCGRGHYCNFMHVKEPAKELRQHLEKVLSAILEFKPNDFLKFGSFWSN